MEQNRKNIIITCALLIVALGFTIFLGIFYKSFSVYQTKFYKEKAVEIHTLKEFSPNLANTVCGDEEVYMIYDDSYFNRDTCFDEKNGVRTLKPSIVQQCPTLLVLGGTHPNEPSGQLAATILLENADVSGKTILFVITETNKSAYTHSHPQEASPLYYTLETASGSSRQFKFGSRATNTNEQWPNPDVYTGLAGQKLSSTDARNLNRSYPGKIDGTYSERIAYGITNLIRTYDIKMTIDLHEASPEYKTINAIIYHENIAGVVANAKMWYLDSLVDENGNNAFDDPISLEPSDPTLRGLTHRELGDYTNTLCVICETSNSAQGKIRGAFTTNLILDGAVDKFYQKAIEVSNERVVEGLDNIIYGNPTSIDIRVARHLECILALIDGYNQLDFSTVTNVLGYEKAEDRQKYLEWCGSMDISLDLTTHNIGLDKVGKDIEGQSVYSLLKKNGVGYFLADESFCK